MNTPSEPNRFNFCMQVWGSAYVDIMLKVGLPSQLTDANLLGFPWKNQSIYEIYTTKSDEKAITDSPAFKLLARTIETRFVHIDHILADNKWPVLRYCHREAVRSADARDATLFFLCPDILWPDGCFTRAASRIIQGYSAVLCPGLRTVRESLVPVLLDKYSALDGRSMPISSRDLVRVCLDHLHPEMRTWFWDSPEYFKCPTYILFDVPDEGISAFCYILHPVALKAQVRNAPFRLIFDQDYLEAACPDTDRIYIAQDSDEVIFFEISPKEAPIPPIPVPTMNSFDAMTWYGEWQYNGQHRQFGKRPIRIHHGPISADKWRLVEERGHHITEEIEKGWETSDRVLLKKRPSNLVRRIEARHRFHPESINPDDRKLIARARAAIESATRRRSARLAAIEKLRSLVRPYPNVVRALKFLRGRLRLPAQRGGSVR